MEEVDLVIWIDFSFPQTLYQVTKRTLIRAAVMQDPRFAHIKFVKVNIRREAERMLAGLSEKFAGTGPYNSKKSNINP